MEYRAIERSLAITGNEARFPPVPAQLSFCDIIKRSATPEAYTSDPSSFGEMQRLINQGVMSTSLCKRPQETERHYYHIEPAVMG